MQSGDRLICAFVRPISLGERFERWPLHVTIVPWFRLEDSTEHIASGLSTALQSVAPFTSGIDKEALFGPRRNRPAMLILKPTPFQEVEQRVRAYLHKKRAWLVDETTKVRRIFRPHVTIQQVDRLRVGDTFECGQVYIVEQMVQYKEVVGAIQLQHE
jgi:2'-5' RNA ligase